MNFQMYTQGVLACLSRLRISGLSGRQLEATRETTGDAPTLMSATESHAAEPPPARMALQSTPAAAVPRAGRVAATTQCAQSVGKGTTARVALCGSSRRLPRAALPRRPHGSAPAAAASPPGSTAAALAPSTRARTPRLRRRRSATCSASLWIGICRRRWARSCA